jgi:predicted permease
MTFLQDLRYAVRTLAKSPGFTAAAILILSLGIGANTAIFSLIDAVVLHSLPGVAKPEGLVDLSGGAASYPWYRSVRETTPVFDGLAAWRQRALNLSGAGVAERIRGGIVSGNYFEVLGARATLGRVFSQADEESGDAIVVLSQRLWRSHFGSDPSIVGKAIQLNGVPFTVIGLAPDGFRGTAFGMAPDLWVPIGSWPRLATGNFQSLDIHKRGWSWLSVFGRLKPGVRLPEAQSGVDVAARRELAAFPTDAPGDMRLTLQPTVRAAAGFGEPGNPVGFLAILAVAVAASLAIACANLANLLLARAAARRKEIAVRQALGASRGRLIGQLLTESVALATLGGAAGVLVASWTLALIVRTPLPGDLSLSTFGPTIDPRALGFSLLLSVATGLAFGLIPAFQASRTPVGVVLKTSGTGAAGRSTARGALVMAQVSLCLVLLLTAGLLGRSLQSALATDLGFQPRGLTLASIHPGLLRYDAARAAVLLKELQQRVAASPGVQEASWVSIVPLSGDQWIETLAIEGDPPPPGKRPEAEINVVGAQFFRAMQIPLVAGRGFDERLDLEGSSPVVLVNEAMAKRFGPGSSALGRRLDIAGANRTVVGISKDFRTGSFRDGAAPQVYLPLSQGLSRAGLETVTLVTRGAAEATNAGALVRAEARRLDPNLPVDDVLAYDAELGGQLVAQRLGSRILGLFGLLSLVLAAVGIYAVVSYSVERRTREIGIRMALGARAADVRSLVVSQSATPLVLGLGLGLALGAAAARLLRGFLFGISPTDPVTFVAGTALLGLCGVAAAWLPALRATRIDPMSALRSE